MSDADALLEGLTRLIARKRDLKQAAVQQLLSGETRLPGFHGGPLTPRDGRMRENFLHLLVQTSAFVDAAGVSYGTHMPRSDWSVLRKLPVQVPSLTEQSAIAAVLSDMDAELAALEARREKTRALKQAMMQELLTGRTRLVGSAAADR